MKALKKCLILVGWMIVLALGVMAVNRYNNRPVLEVSNHQLTEDIEQLVSSMDRAYAGKVLLPEAYAKTVDRLKQIPATHPNGVDVTLLAKEVNEAFSVIPDGHLHAYMTVSFSFQESAAMSSCAVDNDDDEDDPKTVNQITHNGKKVLHLKYATFLVDNENAVDEAITEIKTQMKDSDAVIVDLRENSGGNVHVPLKIAAALWGESYRENAYIPYTPNPYKSSFQLNNNVVYALQANLLLNSTSTFGKVLARRGVTTKELSRAPASDEPDYASSTAEDLNLYNEDEPNIKERGFARPIYILVDTSCASACERFLEVMEYHPYAVSVGQKTSGTVQLGAVGLLTLENSKLSVTLASSYMTYLDGRKVERVGYQPKITVPVEKDLMEVALSEISKM